MSEKVGHLSLTYDIQDMYQIIADVIHSLWPIIAAGLGIMMAGFLMYFIVTVFRRWNEDR